MKTIAFVNQKGGVGKSTVCFNVGAALSLCGFSVLLVDADPQGDLSSMGGIETTEEDLSLYDVLHGEDAVNVVQELRKGFSIIPAAERLTLAEIDLVEEKRTLLRDALKPFKRSFDYALIDCPPSLNVLTVNALTASDAIIIPVQTQYLPLKGVSRLNGTIEKTRAALNKKLKVGGVVLTFYNQRQNLDNAVKESLSSAFGGKVFETVIPRDVKLAEAPSHGLSVFEYAPRCKAAKCFKSLAAEIIERTEPEKKG